MLNELKEIKSAAEAKLKEVASLDELNDLKVKTLGRKGDITLILKKLKDVPAEERAEVGKLANEIKVSLEQMMEEKEQELKKGNLTCVLPGKLLMLPCRDFHL